MLVSEMTRLAVEVIKECIKESLARRFPNEVAVNKANKVSILDTDYAVVAIWNKWIT